MYMKATKNVLAVVVATAAAMIFISVGELFIVRLFPFPAGMDMHNKEAATQAMKLLPQNAFICLLIDYMVASFCAGVVAVFISRRITIRPAIAAGVLLTLAGIYNTAILPHPLWFSIANICCYIPMACLGGKLFLIKGGKTDTEKKL